MADKKDDMPVDVQASPVTNNTQKLVWFLMLAKDVVSLYVAIFLIQDSWQRTLLIISSVIGLVLEFIWALMLWSSMARNAVYRNLPSLNKGGAQSALAKQLLDDLRAGGYVDPNNGDTIMPRLTDLTKNSGTITVDTQPLLRVVQGLKAALSSA